MKVDINIDHPDLVEIERQVCADTPPIIFFIGAGLAKSKGFPLWHELLYLLIDHGIKIQRLTKNIAQSIKYLIKENQYLEAGSLLKKQLGKRLNEKLYQIFSFCPSDDFGIYDYLVRLPCAGYITTNYDTLIESAFAKYHTTTLKAIYPHEQKALSVNDKNPFLIKLHGDASTHNFVLSIEDYIDLEKDKRLNRFLYTLFFHYKIVFLGYGLSDKDILIPLNLLSEDYNGGSQRHVALMPMTIDSKFRRKIEDETSTNIVLYNNEKDYNCIEKVVLNWLQKKEEVTQQKIMFENPIDCTRLLHKHASLISKYIRNAAERSLKWLNLLPTKWSLMVNTQPKAANIAEALISFHTAHRVLGVGESISFKNEINFLLQFHDDGMGFISNSFGVSTIHATALSIYALSLYEDHGLEVLLANQEASEWLMQNVRDNEGGWTTFGSLGKVRIVPSIWAYIALNKMDKFPVNYWSKFRNRLLDSDVIGFSLEKDCGASCAATGWLMWLLSFLKQRSIWSEREDMLLDKCLKQLLNYRDRYLAENEGFLLDEGAPRSKQGIWVRWIHTTAAAVVIGTLPWISSTDKAWSILGAAVTFLLQQASQGIDGHLKDCSIEQEGSIPFVFPTLYGMWALCEVVQYISGALIDKVGLIIIRDKKVLLLRKRGTSQLIVPGGSRKAKETPEEALHREIREELGSDISHVHYWKTFEDAAAYEKGATVRIRAYMGTLSQQPLPRAEIAEMQWVGKEYPPEKLSPIVKNKIIKDLLIAGLIE